MKLSRFVRSVNLLTFTLLALPVFGSENGVEKIPPTDPVTSGAPTISPKMAGIHPRLLFTSDELKARKAVIQKDPLLSKAYEDAVAYCKSFRPPGPNPDIVKGGDTPAIWNAMGFMPTLAFVYAMDRDPEVKDKIVATLTTMLNEPSWSPAGKEQDNTMGTACNMEMVGLLFDSVYNDLDPDLRHKLVEKMLTQCRRMYYLGHLGMGNAIKYWQADPQPNHRWYRDAGLSACLLSIADEKSVETSFLMDGLKKEMELVMKWYPPDGDCHEGAGYQSFGYVSILTAAQMSDRVLGTNYLKTAGIKNAATQQLYYWAQGRNGSISYGDDQNGRAGGFGNNEAAFFAGPAMTKDANMQAALVKKMEMGIAAAKDPSKVKLPWSVLAYYDPTLPGGNYKTLGLTHLFPDMGAATMRDTWDDGGVVFTFKCGPYGGYKLNEYRMSTLQDGKPHYINVAHDDPDANEFALSLPDGFVFHPGVYSFDQAVKITRDHSSITVDDKGQLGEGFGFTQPTGSMDMRELSYLTGWKQGDKGRVIIEGEAGNAYRGQTGPELKAAGNKPADPVLSKFRRTAIWMPGDYILILDDIAANGPHNIMWRGTAIKAVLTGQGMATLTSEGKQLPIAADAPRGTKAEHAPGTEMKMQMVSNKEFTGAVDEKLKLVGRWGTDAVNQVQFSQNTDAIKFACLLDPWNKGVQVKLTDTPQGATIKVTGAGVDDTWTWTPAKDGKTPSTITGKRAGAPLISLTAADKAPMD